MWDFSECVIIIVIVIVKRIETESAKLAEMQESLRVRTETLRAAHEETKILREDLLREGELMDKDRSHIMSPKSTEEITKSRTTRIESVERSGLDSGRQRERETECEVWRALS